MRLKCPNPECSFEELLPDQEDVMTRECPVCQFQGQWTPWLSFRTMIGEVVFNETDARPAFNYALRVEANHFYWLTGIPWAIQSSKQAKFVDGLMTYPQYLVMHEKRLGVRLEGPIWVEDPRGERVLEGVIFRNGPLTDREFIR